MMADVDNEDGDDDIRAFMMADGGRIGPGDYDSAPMGAR